MATQTKMKPDQIMKRIQAIVDNPKMLKASEYSYDKRDKGYRFSEVKDDWKPRLKIFKYKARSKFTFDPVTGDARSYGHWLFARRVRGTILLNTYCYSQTTSSHQSMLRSLLRELSIPFISVDCGRDTGVSLDAGLRRAYRTQFEAEVAETRRNAKPRRVDIAGAKKDIKVLRALGGRISRDAITNIKRAVAQEEQARLASLKDAAVRRAAERAKTAPYRAVKRLLGLPGEAQGPKSMN